MLIAYWKMSQKRILKIFPKLLAGGLIFVCLCGLMIGMNDLLQKREASVQKVHIAIVGNKEDPYLQYIFHMIEEMDSMKYTCSFTWMSAEKAQHMLDRNKIQAIFFTPDNYVQSFESGDMYPLTIRYGKGQADMVSLILKHVVNAATKIILETQAGIYTMNHYYISQHWYEKMNHDSKLLYLEYMNKLLCREDLFRRESNDSFANGIIPYAVACSFFVMLFLGLGCYRLVTGQPRSFSLLLQKKGVSLRKQVFLNYLSFLELYLFVYLFLGIPIFGFATQWHDFLSLFFRCISIPFFTSCLVFTIFRLGREQTEGMLYLFLCILLMLTFSGIFFPVSGFGSVIRSLSEYLPYALLLRSLEEQTIRYSSILLMFCMVLLAGNLILTETEGQCQ